MTDRGLPPWAPPSTLPPLYAGWIGDILTAPPPRETAATCESCAMCGTAADPVALTFRPETKCCTYVPNLPNFLVGRILDDTDTASARGRASVEARITRRIGVTPLGLATPPATAALYRLGGAAAFGRADTLRCPHYLPEEGGRCGIWRHRNGTCSTWFCKHDRGRTGQRLWQMLDQLFFAVERSLARWCVLESTLDADARAHLFPHGTDRKSDPSLDGAGIDGRVDDDRYTAQWGSWAGREAEWFRSRAAHVAGLAWVDVERIGGVDVRLFARLAREASDAQASARLPSRLAAASCEVMSSSRADRVHLVGYSGTDPLEVPRGVLDVLPYFNGGATDEALARIRRDEGVEVERALVGKLVDFGLLRAAD